MPGLILIMERPKMSLQMHENLKRYILRERKKKKEEDVANEQKMREEMRKAEMNTQTLEQTRDQIKQIESKIEDLNKQKKDLFSQLKKVLNEETYLKKRPTTINQQNEPPPTLFQPVPYQNPVFPTAPIRFIPPISPSNRATLFKPETIVQPQAIKRQRSPSPTPSNPPPNIFQSPQHQNLLAQSNQNSMPGLSPGSNQSSVFQPHIFSPNKKSRVMQQANIGSQSQNSQLASLNSYVPVLVGQSQPRLPYNNNPQHSAFSAYPSHFLNSLPHQQQQQKAPLLGLPSNQIHPSSFGLPSRLQHPSLISSQLDPTQKMLFQTQQLLMSQHPQTGGIMAGYPINPQLQRPNQQQQHPHNPNFNN